ncbi:MAG TPA: hypothetical protein VMJ90_01420 [Anaerolineales bacterium]|nr:hypothetical protein [Anaerolineales bacterium]
MKQIHPLFRIVFLTGGGLSLVAGIQLFLLAEQTDVYFAWTIQSPLTAAIMGGFFFGTMTFGFLAFREPVWENVRAGVMGLFVLLCVKLAATVLHLDKFHLNSEQPVTIFVTWMWLATYTLLPIAVLIGFILQRRMVASVSDPGAGLPGWMRSLLILHGLTGLITGIFLFMFPQAIIPHWAWSLTPLTSRAMAAWFLSFAIVDVILFSDNDWMRTKVIAVEYAVSVLFALLALVQYSNEVNWPGLGALGFLAYLAVMLIIGVVGSLKRT